MLCNIRHVGDLGNVTAGKDGIAHVYIEDPVIALSGDHSIIGRTMVVSFRVIRRCVRLLPTRSCIFAVS